MARPYVICHMCTSIDGKILSKRWGRLPGRKDIGSLFESTADSFGIGAWIVGTTTMKEFAGRNVKLKRAKAPVERSDNVADPKARRFAIGVDAKGVLRFQHGEVDGDHVVLLVTRQVGDDYLAHLRAAGVSYLFCGATAVDLPAALAKLRRTFGIKKLLLEGGGTFNGSMLQAGLVDEVSQVVAPVVDGGAGVTGVFDIPGDPPPRAAAILRMISHRTLPGSVSWSRYRVVTRPRPAERGGRHRRPRRRA
jgi:2,5-diamino-6-(ribosylamino)-4(3H)-pyrimidinone 5'-phosphate reductase